MNKIKAIGGVAPFGYRWENGLLVVDENEAPVRRLIYDLFLKHRRKKTVAKLLNDLGHRTRSASRFSDTTVDRLLRDATAKGVREVDGRVVEVEPIISVEMWERVNDILRKGGSPRQARHLFTGKAYCSCGGKMFIPGNTPKYVCADCRRKILVDDLEAVFRSQLANFPGTVVEQAHDHWEHFSEKEKRLLVENTCERIVIDGDTITIRFGLGFAPDPESMPVGQHIEKGNETAKSEGNDPASERIAGPLLSEAEAAKYLGISKMTLLRNRNAGNVGFFRVGFRVLYSKEEHLFPFLAARAKLNRPGDI